MRISDWSSDVCSSDLAAIRSCGSKGTNGLKLDGVRSSPIGPREAQWLLAAADILQIIASGLTRSGQAATRFRGGNAKRQEMSPVENPHIIFATQRRQPLLVDEAQVHQDRPRQHAVLHPHNILNEHAAPRVHQRSDKHTSELQSLMR